MRVRDVREKIVDGDAVRALADDIRASGRTIATTNGCFDIVHRGHVEYLQEAARHADVLIVGVNSDESVRRLKGPTRPVNDEHSRALVLAALGFVDYCVIFGEQTPVELLGRIRPHVHVKGGDYRPDDLPEKVVVEAGGGRIVIVGLVDGFSTTGIIGRMSG